MGNLLNTRYFKQDGQNHEKCDLSNYTFQDIDYSELDKEISFFRSDFSRSRFFSCTFYKNLFGRADFISVCMVNTEFDSVDFGSCMIKNSFFSKTHFKNNRYHGVAMQYNSFQKCVFRDELFITNMYQCEFVECTFINCKFEKSSLDTNSFCNCEFIKVDISECIAENLRFDNCSLRDVFLCSNMWASYLYKKTDISNFGFKYRGEIVDIWDGNAESFIKDLFSKEMYFEYLNSLIIGNYVSKGGLIDEFKKVIPLVISLPVQIRKNSVNRILDMLLFYQNYGRICFVDYINIYDYLTNYDWSVLSFDETIIYKSKLFKINKVIENMDFDISYMTSIPSNMVCIAKFHLNFNDETLAIKYLENAFRIANETLCDGIYLEPLVTIFSKESGSVILTIASCATLVILVSYAAKKIAHNIMSIQVEQSLKKALIQKIKDPKTTTKELKNDFELAKKYDFLPSEKDNKAIDKLSSELVNGEILDITLSFLT